MLLSDNTKRVIDLIEMFDDLIREFSRKRPELKGKSHFDMLNFSAENIRKRVMNKYNKKQKYVI